jgi:hypothetical protein
LSLRWGLPSVHRLKHGFWGPTEEPNVEKSCVTTINFNIYSRELEFPRPVIFLRYLSIGQVLNVFRVDGNIQTDKEFYRSANTNYEVTNSTRHNHTSAFPEVEEQFMNTSPILEISRAHCTHEAGVSACGEEIRPTHFCGIMMVIWSCRERICTSVSLTSWLPGWKIRQVGE